MNKECELVVISLALALLHQAKDTLMRVCYKASNVTNACISQERVFRGETESDSQALGYGKLIGKFLNNPSDRKRFRRNFQYRMILEHVSYSQGCAYINRIAELGIVDFNQIQALAKSDLVGSPRRYYYNKIGWVSPTLLRYASVYSEIEKFIGFKNIKSVVEIGIGYGGQARVIHDLAGISNYTFYDLPDVQKLAEHFLKETSKQLNPRKSDIHSVERENFDLVISNYAISELPADVQREYLDKVMASAKHFYMIMNSGASDVTRRSTGKLSQSDFVFSIPGVAVTLEIPSTGPDNYVLIK